MGRTAKNPLPMMKSKSGAASIPNIDKCKVDSANPRCWEEDHLISLQLGGAPRDPDNLWPEPWFGDWNAKDKDSLESRLNAMVCSGQIGLRDAQKEIAADWVAAYKKNICDSGTKLTPLEKQACAKF